ncbi:MAG: hypothetical protein Q8R24_08125 [Legionellaceae bacterium]|nr:hypothetical protein [Legionellaceae bacterium]
MKRYRFFLVMIFAASAAMASAPNNCAFFSVMINNNTENTCQLIEKQVIQGTMSSSTQVPVLIPSGTSSYPFEMKQVFYGPDIILTYECGQGRVITFESHQGLCVMDSGSITGSILSSSNLKARCVRDRGSYLWNQHGAINWTLY